MVSDLLFRLRALFRRRSMEAELDEELRNHLEHQVEKYIQSGMSADKAESRARFDFGNLEQVKEECRNSWGVKPFDQLVADVQCGLHWMSRSPGVAFVTVLAIALGVLANTAIFGVVDTSVSQLLPHKETTHVALASKRLEGPKKGRVVKPALAAWKLKSRTHERTGSFGLNRRARVAAEVSEPASVRIMIVAAGPFRMEEIQKISADAKPSRQGIEGQNQVALISDEQKQTPLVTSFTLLRVTLHRDNVSYTVVELLPGTLELSPAGAPIQMAFRTSVPVHSKRGNILRTMKQLRQTSTASEVISTL